MFVEFLVHFAGKEDNLATFALWERTYRARLCVLTTELALAR